MEMPHDPNRVVHEHIHRIRRVHQTAEAAQNEEQHAVGRPAKRRIIPRQRAHRLPKPAPALAPRRYFETGKDRKRRNERWDRNPVGRDGVQHLPR